MRRPLNLRRSWLFVGAVNEEDIEASYNSKADVCILDLEDFCIPTKRSQGRKNLQKILRKWRELGKVTAVRINPLETIDGKRDLEAAICKYLDVILLAKVEMKKQINLFIKEKKKNELIKNIKNNYIEFIPNIESALGIENLNNIINSKYVTGALIASEDMALSLGIFDSKENDMLNFARKKFHFSCRSYGKLSIDMPYTRRNVFELKKELNYAKKIGIIAKSTVNASHCKIINETLTPSKKEVLKSIKIKNKFENAIKENKRQVFHNGQYLELPAFKAAVSILNRHYALLSYENL